MCMCVCVCVCVCVCARSHCSEHPWRLRSEVFIPDKRSIFALTPKPDDEEAAQQYAADDDDNDDDDDDEDDDVTAAGGELAVITDAREPSRCQYDEASAR